MNIVFLGTASCFPTPTRGVSCMALQWESSGEIWIFDCGEGSQIQIQKSKLKPGKVTKIFITHLHGDHLFGLPGFLCTLGNGGGDIKNKVIDLYGPLGLKRYVETSLQLSQSPLPYQYRYHEIVPLDYQLVTREQEALHQELISERNDGELVTYNEDSKCWHLFSSKMYTVVAGPLIHRVPSFGFVITEADAPGALDMTKLASYGIKPGPKCGILKQGGSITLEDGRLVQSEDVLGPKKKGRKVAIFGDTSDSSSLRSLCQNCDLIIHEATMEDALKEKAIEYGHSTPSMTAQFAFECKAHVLCLTHLSPRYKPISLIDNTNEDSNEDTKSAQVLLDEAREKMKALSYNCFVDIAEDFYEIKVIKA